MNNSRIAVLFICVSLLIFSCGKDWYDVKSDKNLTVPQSLEDLEYLMNSYVKINTTWPGLSEVSSDGHYMLEQSWLSPSLSNSERNAYTWSNTHSYDAVEDWNATYERISICNIVLEALSKLATEKNTDRYNRVYGDALFVRSKSFFDLSQIYVPPYEPAVTTRKLGLPLKIRTNVTELSVRSTIQETYDRITNDLQLAVKLLPRLSQTSAKASKNACYALLARVYLSMSEYEMAHKYADSALAIYSDLIDFSTINPTAANLGRFNKETIYFSSMVTRWYTPYLYGFAFVDSTLYSLFNENDLRKIVFFRLDPKGIVFKGNYNTGSARFTGLATDELFLIMAETLARKGAVSESMEYLNDLIRTRWNKEPGVVYPEYTASSAKEALNYVLLERKKELLFRNTRWSDLRRLNLEDANKVILTRSIGGQVYELLPNSFRYTLPIPRDVLSYSNMEQNPGW